MNQKDLDAILELLAPEDRQAVLDKLNASLHKAASPGKDLSKPVFETPPSKPVFENPKQQHEVMNPVFENGIAIPEPRMARSNYAAYDQMKVGQSCVFPSYKSAQSVIYRFKKYGWEYVVRKVHPDGTQVRFWRTK